LGKPPGISDELIVEEVKQEATILVGPYNQKENDSYVKCCPDQVRVNHCFLEMGVQYGAREAARAKRGRGAGTSAASAKSSVEPAPKRSKKANPEASES